MSIISIVAGGWSVKEWDLNMISGYIIAVNDSALHLPRLNCVVTMDRLWTEARWDWLCEHKFPFFARAAAVKNLPVHDKLWFTMFECDHKSSMFSKEQGTLNGTNSGGCAFNLAYLRRPAEIQLYGFDMCLGPNGERHWYPDYEWKSGGGPKPATMKNWSAQFKLAANICKEEGIWVKNMSSRSLIKDFDRYTPYMGAAQ